MQQPENQSISADKPRQPYVLEGLRLSVAPMMDWMYLLALRY